MTTITIGAVNPKPGSARRYHTGTWRTMRPVYDLEKCKKCWLCYEYCPDAAVIKDEENGPKVDYDYCKGCGICAYECKFGAIEMVLEEK